ncbi:MAG: hypothetical protein WD227_07965 [Vicinamibacterales bacterium]
MVAGQRIIYARYLLPLVPMLCVLAAAVVISGVSLLRRYQFPRGVRTALIAGLTLALLGPPAVSAVGFNRMISRTSTTDLAYRWVVANVPEGSLIVHEGNHLTFPARYRSERISQLRHRTYEDYADSGADYLIASSQSYGPYLESPQAARDPYREYMTLFARARELARFTADKDHPGPELRILKVTR